MNKSMESVMWQVIEDMNFNERGHKEAGLYLINESGLTLSAMKKVELFARRKCAALYSQLFDVEGVSDIFHNRGDVIITKNGIIALCSDTFIFLCLLQFNCFQPSADKRFFNFC